LTPVRAGLDSLRFKVMPVKVLGCPVPGPLSAVSQGGKNAEKQGEDDENAAIAADGIAALMAPALES
jgi:hypothetical protein